MRRIVKVVFLFLSISLFSVLFALVHCIIFSRLRLRMLAHCTFWFGKLTSFVTGVKVTINGSVPINPGKSGFFFVCNHVSYLDGFVTSSLFPLLFISRGDLKDWPLLGFFTRLSGTVFVNRSSTASLNQDIERIEQVLLQGVNVILFPEGTTSDGNKMLPFKSSFFQAPLSSKSPVVPLVINYRAVDGVPVDEHNKDKIYWYSEMKFFSHLFKVLELKKIEVDLRVHTPYYITDDFTRKTLRTLSQKTIEDDLKIMQIKESLS